MSLATDVASVLRHDPVGRISYSIGGFAVNRTQMETVAIAIEKTKPDIDVAVQKPGKDIEAGYTSLRDFRLKEGETKYIGRFTLPQANDVRTPDGRAGIFHECLHALADLRRDHFPKKNTEEAFAYVGEAMYRRALKNSVRADSTAGQAIYDAAFALVDTHGMLEKKRAIALTWDDCSDLLDALNATGSPYSRS
jgi:hypothetical protein